MNEAHKWQTGDTLRSIKDILSLGVSAVKAVVEGIDTRNCNRLNGDDDE